MGNARGRRDHPQDPRDTPSGMAFAVRGGARRANRPRREDHSLRILETSARNREGHTQRLARNRDACRALGLLWWLCESAVACFQQLDAFAERSEDGNTGRPSDAHIPVCLGVTGVAFKRGTDVVGQGHLGERPVLRCSDSCCAPRVRSRRHASVCMSVVWAVVHRTPLALA